MTVIQNNLSFSQKQNVLPREPAAERHSVSYSGVKKKNWITLLSQNIRAGELVGLVPSSTHNWRNLTLRSDRWTGGLGHGHSLWQITRSQLRPAVHMEDPRWDRVQCNPSLTCLASTLLPLIPLSLAVCHTSHGATACWQKCRRA